MSTVSSMPQLLIYGGKDGKLSNTGLECSVSNSLQIGNG